MQSYKIYFQKLSIILPDKRYKIIEILWHIFSKFIYIFLENLEWQLKSWIRKCNKFKKIRNELNSASDRKFRDESNGI